MVIHFSRAFPALSAFTIIGWSVMLSSCAWTPRKMSYPDGLTVILGDHNLLDKKCSHTKDNGQPLGHDEYAAGCYDGFNDTIYLLNNCEGAKALTHELAHRQGISDPEKAGFNQ